MNFLKKAKKVLTPEDAFNGTAAIKFAQGGLFAPGERVGGELIWTRNKACAIRNITAALHGSMKCPKFREPGGMRVLLASHFRLVYQSPRGSNKPQIVDKGASSFAFSLPDLPPAGHGLPDSFVWNEEGLCAAYWIEFVFFTGDKKKHVCRAPFVMMRPVPDLRRLPLAASKIPNMFKAPNHKVSLSVAQMPPLVHPGQEIDLEFRIVNCSTKPATCLSIQLERRTHLHGKKQVATVASAIFTEPAFILPRLPKGLDPQSSQDIAPKVERLFSLQIPANLNDLPNSWDFRAILSVKYTLSISLLLGSSRWTLKHPVVLRETDPLSLITKVPVVPPQQAPESYYHRPAPPPPSGPGFQHGSSSSLPPYDGRPRSSTSPDYYGPPMHGGPPPLPHEYGGGYYYPPPPHGGPPGPYMYSPVDPSFPVHAYHLPPGGPPLPPSDYGHFPPPPSSSTSHPAYMPDYSSHPPPSSSSTPSLPTMSPHPHYFPPHPAQSSLPTLPTQSPSPTLPFGHSDPAVAPLYPVLDYPPAPWTHSPGPHPSDHFTTLPHSWTPPPSEFTIRPTAPPIDA